MTWLFVFFLAPGLLMAEPATSKALLSARTRLILIRAPEIQSELRLDQQQLKALSVVVEKVDLPLWQGRDLPYDQAQASALPLLQTLQEGVAGILHPHQNQRFDQLVLRFEGWRTLQLPSVLDRLNLTDQQKQDYTVFCSGFTNLTGKTLSSILGAEAQWIQRQLTAAQRQSLSELLGSPYDFARCRLREVKAPEIAAVDYWLNRPPLKLDSLRGRVVVVNFWTYGCINCIRNLPHYRKWQAQLPPDRVVMMAFHTPETQDEYDFEKVKSAVKKEALTYPIAIDNQKVNWKAWGNNIWPSVYLIDKQGYVRHWWYGELNWQGATGEKQMREKIYELMAEK